MDGVLGREEAEKLQERLLYFAWRKYQIPRDVAEDVVQSALLTYLEVRGRYENTNEHPRILYGIFRNKCREHISREVKAQRDRKAFKEAVQAGDGEVNMRRAHPRPDGGVLAEIVAREEGRVILNALSQSRAPAREMFELIRDGATRKDLIEHYGLNPNTLDSRLHSYRRELRSRLGRGGLDC